MNNRNLKEQERPDECKALKEGKVLVTCGVPPSSCSVMKTNVKLVMTKNGRNRIGKTSTRTRHDWITMTNGEGKLDLMTKKD